MNSEDIVELPAPAADERLTYGPDSQQFLEIFAPKKNAKRRCLVFIHGGFWRAKYDLKHGLHLCHDMAQRGWTAVGVEYRRVGNDGGGWPGTFSDLRNALAQIRSSAKKFQFDTHELVVMGHSAGGQLAIALAGHDPNLRKAVSLAGVLDLKKAYELHLSNDAVVEFMGGTPAQVAEQYKEASPAALHITARQVIVHGEKDDTVPFSISSDYVRQKQHSERIQFLALPDTGHYELIDPRTEQWKKIVAAL
jgi:acetyl esterase/lipase